MSGHAPSHGDGTTQPQAEFPARVPEPGYEVSDTNVRAVVGFGVSLAVFLAVTLAVLAWAFGSVARRRPPLPNLAAPRDVADDMKLLRADESAALGGYARVPGEPDYARIPIDRAMELMVEKGVPFGKGRKTDVQINTRIKQ